ncbi:exodeoxyribonuclease VII large subunit [Hugonella massiliensis]|uniref:exodeoxyribonuclease VII large subunit n=1 Tax=Hugonella massiliensis TaxID=1720315 RepID=UPI00073F03FD|nr:exodeoxyribonuclease VII large subunit [Hugonella massiliensis]
MAEEPAQDKRPLTVSQAMALAKGALENCVVTLVGEVSEVSVKPGYKAAYFTVKDTGASMPCMMWTNRYKASGVKLRVGMLVQMTGRFTLYAPKGRMNFDVFSLSMAGEGDLRKQVADLAEKLRKQGLMAPERKRALPAVPHKIGLVTSPRGAAVHDVLRTLRRRWPAARVVLAGVPVEGKVAPAALMSGMKAVVDAGAQVVLLVRGGGSFEDLMPFNDERLAITIARCPVPVVTGIGHEPDTSIADMVADLRASTPTAAAEAAIPDVADVRGQLAATGDRMASLVRSQVRVQERAVAAVAGRPVFKDPESLFATDAQTLDILGDRLHRAIPASIDRDRASLAALNTRLATRGRTLTRAARMKVDEERRALVSRGSALVDGFDAQWRLSASRLNDLSPLAVIGRGYALARNEEGKIVASIADAPVGSRLSVRVGDGTLAADVVGATHDEQTEIPWKEG